MTRVQIVAVQEDTCREKNTVTPSIANTQAVRLEVRRRNCDARDQKPNDACNSSGELHVCFHSPSLLLADLHNDLLL